jgi:hypothetical protein
MNIYRREVDVIHSGKNSRLAGLCAPLSSASREPGVSPRPSSSSSCLLTRAYMNVNLMKDVKPSSGTSTFHRYSKSDGENREGE